MTQSAITLTRQGVEVCRRIEAAFPETVVFVADKYDAQAPTHWRRFDGKLRPLLDEIFGRFEAHIFVMATGIVVRVIAPYVSDKRLDPAVVVIDVTARFAVSLCSGHLGGANALARSLAQALGATPVITTGTDVNETLSPDLLAKELGAEIENWQTLKVVSGALVDGEPVAVFAEPSVKLPDLTPLAEKKVRVVESPEAFAEGFRAAILLSHRTDIALPAGMPVLLIRPRDLVVGIGCDRGVAADEIEAAIARVFAARGLSRLSIRQLATYALKKDEPGLVEFAARNRLELAWFEKDEINRLAERIPNPSKTVMSYVGVAGVAEPAAMLAAGTDRLLVEKVKCERVTVAVALAGAEELKR